MKAEDGILREHCRVVLLAGTLITLLLLGVPFATMAEGDRGGGWYLASLEQGETQGYSWAVGVKGPKYEPLREICIRIAMVEPPQAASPLEGRESTDCGSLTRPASSLVANVSFGVGIARLTVLAAAYRPNVLKVTFILGAGERKVFYPHLPRVPNRSKRGIPLFRYQVASFTGETCIRRVIIVDGKGVAVGDEVRPSCPTGTGNL